MIRLYGIAQGNSSWPRVGEGMRYGLASLKQLAGFYDMFRVNSETDSSGLEEGYQAPVGVCVGPPSSASVMVGRGQHQQRLMMIAANSSWLPEVALIKISKMVTGFLAPSAWSADVIRQYVKDVPVRVWRHGVSVGFSPIYQRPAGDRIEVLHMTSTHMARKGTRELIHGWCQMIRKLQLSPKDLRLTLIVDGPRGYFLQEIFAAAGGDIPLAESIHLQARRDLSILDARTMYCRHHIVCQPSRGEGFGMVPLEARACGLVVVATNCTGHQEHLEGCGADDGVVLVPHGPEELIDDGPGAMAPSVAAEDVAQSLAAAVTFLDPLWQAAQDRAAVVRAAWSWPAVTKQFLAEHGSELA